MIKALLKIALVLVCAVLLFAIGVAILVHFTNEKRDNKEYWGGYGLPTEFKN